MTTDEAAALRARIAELEAAAAWRPIETAPKQGEFLVKDRFGGAWLIDGESGFPKQNGCGCCVSSALYDATHWKPLDAPPPPVSSS